MPKLLFPLALLLAIFAVGCEKAEPEPEEPPPPTPEEIAMEATKRFGFDSPIPPPKPIDRSVTESFLAQLRQWKVQQSATPEGQEAVKIITDKISDRTRNMEAAAVNGHKVWDHVLAICQAYKIMDEDSKRFQLTEERAIVELKKPQVTIKGFFAGNGNPTAMINVRLPLEGKTEAMQVRVGQEFHGLEVLEVIGQMKGLRFEYLETGEEFNVMLSE